MRLSDDLQRRLSAEFGTASMDTRARTYFKLNQDWDTKMLPQRITESERLFILKAFLLGRRNDVASYLILPLENVFKSAARVEPLRSVWSD
jgi:hypothetical protein